MVHSQLQDPSLLCALLMLLPLGMHAGFSNVPFTDPVVQKALALGVELRNKDPDDANNFKLLRITEAKSQMLSHLEYHLSAVMVKTSCKKVPGETKTYQMIQQCDVLQGNPRKICFFIVTSGLQLNNMRLVFTSCFISQATKDPMVKRSILGVSSS